ncbi:MAG: hypothetical protein H8E98_02575, partial [Bacteroidetes bacterium]|nr:hypothetical protein [Bacteroidota bacterium]
MVKCEICGLEMKMRLNGSHLFRKHGITIEEYKQQYPSAELGEYKTGTFKCAVCNETIDGNSAIKLKHIKTHGFNNVHEYNIEHTKRLCECGCGKLSEYSYDTISYKDYIDGHFVTWNKGYTKESSASAKVFYEKMFENRDAWNKGLTKETDSRVMKASESMKESKKNWTEDQTQNMVNNIKKTCLEKYGVDNAFKSKEVIKKIKETSLEKYGVESYTQTEEYIKKTKKTKLERYGDENYVNIEKNKKTCLEKYGVENPSQHPDIFYKGLKTRFTSRKYRLPSGKDIMLQGYEPFAMDILLEIYDESNLFTAKNGVPEIWYEYKGKKHRYYPDIFIKSENKIIEVKSIYTMTIDRDKIDAKCKSVIDSGYDMEIWVI